MALYLGEEEIGAIVDLTENIDTELTEQEEELAGLEEEVNALEDKPKSDIQHMIDETNSCQYLFYNYSGTSLPFINKLDTCNVTTMGNMFDNCQKLLDLDMSNLDASKVTNMESIFSNCYALKKLYLGDKFNTSNVKNMMYMFNGCRVLKSLDLSNFDTSNVLSMASMFRSCQSLTSLDLSNWNTSNVTNMGGMFASIYNSNFTILDLSSFNTSNVTVTSSMFESCTYLKTILGNIDMIKATSVNSMFKGCRELETITLKNIKVSLTMGSGTSYGAKLSNDTLINTIQQLWDLTGSTSQTLTLSPTSKNNIANIYVKLITPTEEQIAEDPYINNKKPCVVCEPTDEGAMTLTEYATSKNWSIA